MEALAALAVAERDIRALSTARADRCPLRRPRASSPRARLALPVRQDEICGEGYRTFTVQTACATYIFLAD
jgi:hypothetical protein